MSDATTFDWGVASVNLTGAAVEEAVAARGIMSVLDRIVAEAYIDMAINQSLMLFGGTREEHEQAAKAMMAERLERERLDREVGPMLGPGVSEYMAVRAEARYRAQLREDAKWALARGGRRGNYRPGRCVRFR